MNFQLNKRPKHVLFNRAGWGPGPDSRLCSLPNPGALPLPRLSAENLLFSSLMLPMAGGVPAWRPKAAANEAPALLLGSKAAILVAHASHGGLRRPRVQSRRRPCTRRQVRVRTKRPRRRSIARRWRSSRRPQAAALLLGSKVAILVAHASHGGLRRPRVRSRRRPFARR